MESIPNDLAAYLLDNYGTCKLGAACNRPPGCLKLGWIGRACPHWQPLGARTYEELRDLQAKRGDVI